jgi:hypothetical protein
LRYYINSDFAVDHVYLATGLTYFTTVTLCNTAGMCTSVTSDGVMLDNSPPVPGRVIDGTDATDAEYHALR